MTMLVVSMDHSPQEIPNDRNTWHTSVLLASLSADQWGWNSVLGPLINPQGGKLRKWASRNAGRYKGEFRRHFPELLASNPVFGLALRVSGGAMVDCLPQIITQFGLERSLLLSADKVRVVGVDSGEEFTIGTAQAAYVMYLSHFICRMHALVLQSLAAEDQSITWCDWQISPDNFPQGVNGPMATLFSIVANSAAGLGLVQGNLRVLTMVNGDPGVEICDNLAGMLREDFCNPPGSLRLVDSPAKGSLYWERHG
ncbi:hypothetical protein HJB77_27190 [Rhizobium lentis]|uniref:hypothetical protein n=1 Tax=Rhizobium lentis TaxID=1138194 RepID=UPI001C82D2AF|nr:hypothetical protein [Rhizobium lentis]MBX5179908.1 hypothetical protein [Rhizobium lentis]